MTTTYRFSEVRMTKKAMTFCTECKQSLSRTLSRSYYRNGFHNEADTRAKYQAELNAEAVALAEKGLVCKRCSDIRDNTPIVKKLSDGKWEAYDRQSGALIGCITSRQWGSGYMVPGYNYQIDTLAEAAQLLKERSEKTKTRRIGYSQSDNPDKIFRTYKDCEDHFCELPVTKLNGDDGYIEPVVMTPDQDYYTGEE